MLCFLSCKFTSVADPQLLSLGLVTLDGREHYLELDLATDVAKARIALSSEFVRDAVLPLWGKAGTARTTEEDIGRRTAEWLLTAASEPEARVEIAFDFETDLALLLGALQRSDRWDRIEVASVDVAILSRSIDGSYLAEACYFDLAARGLKRHHALADALALRAIYLGVKDTSARMTRIVHSEAYRRLVAMVIGWIDPAYPGRFDAEAWLHRWFLDTSIDLENRRPLEIFEEPDGPARVDECLRRLEGGTY